MCAISIIKFINDSIIMIYKLCSGKQEQLKKYVTFESDVFIIVLSFDFISIYRNKLNGQVSVERYAIIYLQV